VTVCENVAPPLNEELVAPMSNGMLEKGRQKVLNKFLFVVYSVPNQSSRKNNIFLQLNKFTYVKYMKHFCR